MFLFWLLTAAICAIIGYNMGDKRSVGAGSGAVIGALLGIIGLIILLFFPVVKEDPIESSYFPVSDRSTVNTPANGAAASVKADELQKWYNLHQSGAITTEEYDIQKKRILEG